MDDSDPSESRPSDLHRWHRVLCGLVGTSAFGAGAVAVFTSDNGTGTAALIASGLLLSLVSATGRLPLKGSIAGVDYDMGERIVERALDTLPPEAAQQVAEIAVAEADHGSLAGAATRRLWRYAALDAVQRLAPEGAHVEVDPPTTRADVALTTPDATLLLETQYGRVFRSQQVALARQLAGALLPRTRHLIVSTSPQPQGAKFVIWRGPADDERLRAALAHGLRSFPPPQTAAD